MPKRIIIFTKPKFNNGFNNNNKISAFKFILSLLSSGSYGKEILYIGEMRLLNQVIIDALSDAGKSNDKYFKNFREKISFILNDIKDEKLKVKFGQILNYIDNDEYREGAKLSLCRYYEITRKNLWKKAHRRYY